MFSRLGLRPLLAGAALIVFSQIAPAQPKVAVVNLQRAVFESAEIKKADAEMLAKFKPRQDELNALQTEIEGLAKQLQGGKLTPQQESDITAQGQRKQRDFQRKQQDLNDESQAYRNDILSKSTDKMTAVIKKLAEEKGLDLIIDTSTTLYYKDALDVTKDAIAAYDKAHPVTAATPAK